MEVDIDWPHQVGNDKTQGKWLLYLEKLPTVGGNGECFVDDKYVNPLKLTNKDFAENLVASASTYGSLRMKPSNRSRTFAEHKPSSTVEKVSSSSIIEKSSSSSTFEKSSSSFSTSEKKSSNEEVVHNRVRRDHAMIIRSEKLTDSDGKKTNFVTMVRTFSMTHLLPVSLTTLYPILGLQAWKREMY